MGNRVLDILEGKAGGGGFNLDVRKAAPKTEDEQVAELETLMGGGVQAEPDAFGAGLEDAAPVEAEAQAEVVAEVAAPAAIARPAAKPSPMREKLVKALGEEAAEELLGRLEQSERKAVASDDTLTLAKFSRAYPELKNPKVFEAIKAMGGDFRASLTTLYGDRKATAIAHTQQQMTAPTRGTERQAPSKDQADEAAASALLGGASLQEAMAIKSQLLGVQAPGQRRSLARRGSLGW